MRASHISDVPRGTIYRARHRARGAQPFLAVLLRLHVTIAVQLAIGLSRCRGRLPRWPSLECGGSAPLLRRALGTPDSFFEPGSFFSSSLPRFFRILCALYASVAIS